MRRTSAYHPQTNAIKERFNGTLGGLLRRYSNEELDNWDSVLTSAIHAYRSSIHQGTGYSPYYLCFGKEPLTPLDLKLPVSKEFNTHKEIVKYLHDNTRVAREEAKENIESQQRKSKDRYDQKATNIKFDVGDLVMIKNGVKRAGKAKKLQPKFTGPFKLVEKLSEVTFRVKNRGDKKGTVIHVNRMKKFFERNVHW